MGSDDLQRDIGVLEGEMTALKGQVSGMDARHTASLAAMGAKVDSIHDVVMKAQGGWRMLVIVGTVCAGISAVVTTIVEAFHKAAT